MELNGYEIVYKKDFKDQTYSSEIQSIGNSCRNTTVLCFAAGDKKSDSLIIVACGNCKKITTLNIMNNTSTTETASTENFYQVESGLAYWYFSPNTSVGFSSNYLYFLPNSFSGNLWWELDRRNENNDYYNGITNNTILNKYIFKKEINSLYCLSKRRIEIPLSCNLDLNPNSYTSFNITIDYGDNQTNSFISASNTISFTKSYENVGNYLIKVYIQPNSIQLNHSVQISKS